MPDEAVGTTAPSSPAPASPASTPTIGAPPQQSPVSNLSQQGAPPVSTAPEPLDAEYISRGGRWKLGEDDLRAVPRELFERMNAAAESELLENLQRARNGPQYQNGQQNGQPYQPQQNGQIRFPAQSDQSIQQPNQQQQQQQQQQQGPFVPADLKFDADTDVDSPSIQYMKTLNEASTRNSNALYQHFDAKINEIAGVMEYLREFSDSILLDQHLGELGSEWEDTFGKGPTMSLDPKLPTRIQREAYRKAIMDNLNLDATLGRERNLSEAALRARYRVYGQKIAAIERSKRETKARETAQTLPGPTGAATGRSSEMGLRESLHRAFVK